MREKKLPCLTANVHLPVREVVPYLCNLGSRLLDFRASHRLEPREPARNSTSDVPSSMRHAEGIADTIKESSRGRHPCGNRGRYKTRESSWVSLHLQHSETRVALSFPSENKPQAGCERGSPHQVGMYCMVFDVKIPGTLLLDWHVPRF